ncbi:MAG: hypothetical protein R3192_04385 [Woeseiaceae bacterium]|nr:hypothetical protein [Woeseiaceae bacterium]
MNADILQSNWAAWLALGAILIAVAVIVPRLLQRTSSAKLKRVTRDMARARKALRKATRACRKAETRLERMTRRQERVKPRLLQEAKDALEDAKSLQKILGDKVLVTENHVRRVIYDEFPPTAHDRLRKKYLPQDIKDKRPFSF